MSNWNTINQIYYYDGSFNGILTIVFDCYVTKTIPVSIVSTHSNLSLFTKEQRIVTDPQKASRILQGILTNISSSTFTFAHDMFLSTEKEKELLIVRYLLLGFCIGPKIDHLLSNPLVLKFQKVSKHIRGETHCLSGLVRFQELSPNLFYSKIHPENHILELLGEHFKNRYPNQNFILHDKTYELALLYNTKDTMIVPTSHLTISSFGKEELNYEHLWKTFYQAISIPERENPRLQRQFMPKKYWQDLIEKQPPL